MLLVVQSLNTLPTELSWLNDNIRTEFPLPAASVKLVSCLAYYSALKIEATCSSETSADSLRHTALYLLTQNSDLILWVFKERNHATMREFRSQSLLCLRYQMLITQLLLPAKLHKVGLELGHVNTFKRTPALHQGTPLFQLRYPSSECISTLSSVLGIYLARIVTKIPVALSYLCLGFLASAPTLFELSHYSSYQILTNSVFTIIFSKLSLWLIN